ncbi:AMP-binding protein [Rhizobium leguminosarum]|uniref:AMP-binding protein n=1 Tax=Rhizobium leguminosarum TaxID=384 RepID=UPI001C8FD329|nr:AMP-binding protein [Rhizobium leguminosarum]MBY2989331.1 D-alanine--poly(phosphoribitol) ligase [Rhizobium leguminosarum]
MGDASLMSRIQVAFDQFATKAAIDVEGRSYTYAEMHRHALKLMNYVAETSQQKLFLLSTRKTFGAYVSVLGAMQQGYTYVPVNPDLPIERVESIINSARATIIIVGEADSRWAEDLTARGLIACAIVVKSPTDGTNEIDTALIAASDVKGPVSPIFSDDLKNPIAYIMFTSGTTGTPKGIPIRHSNLMAYLRAIEPIVALSCDDRCSQIFDLSFDLSVHDCLVTWSSGACLCIPAKSDLFQLARYIKRYAITVLFCVPSAIRQILQGCAREEQALRSLRLSLFCGEALTVQDALSWLSATPKGRYLNLYGPTEATIAISTFEIFEHSLRSMAFLTVPIGEPIGDAVFELLELQDGGQELWIRGEQVFEGYLDASLNEGSLLEVKEVGRSYRTGDLVISDDLYGYVFKGRRDGQVKINGYRIELLDLETTLERCLKDVIVYVLVENDQAGSFIHVYAYGPGLTEDALRSACAEHLPRYMWPKSFSVLDRPYLNSNGKKDRKSVLNK